MPTSMLLVTLLYSSLNVLLGLLAGDLEFSVYRSYYSIYMYVHRYITCLFILLDFNFVGFVSLGFAKFNPQILSLQ